MKKNEISYLEEMRKQLTDCKFERMEFVNYDFQELKSMEWWVHSEGKQLLIIVSQDGFNIFRFIGNQFTTVRNLSEIAIIAHEEKDWA